MSSLYASYLRERTGDSIIECEQGFVTYRYLSNTQVYIVDIYVRPEDRKSRVAASLADLVAAEARERGCTTMVGTVVPSTLGATTSLQVLLHYGMYLDSATTDLIVFKKEL